MNGAELKCFRESFGITTKALAECLEVNEKTVKRWESSNALIANNALSKVNALQNLLVFAIADCSERMLNKHYTHVLGVKKIKEITHPILKSEKTHRIVLARAYQSLPHSMRLNRIKHFDGDE